jgi:hypothetical protein
MKLERVTCVIDRASHLKIEKEVPSWELPVLKAVHEGNVSVLRSESYDGSFDAEKEWSAMFNRYKTAQNEAAESIKRSLAASVVLPSGQVLICGGLSDTSIGTIEASADVFDPVAGTFTPTGSMSTGRFNHFAVALKNGLVLVAGGFFGERLVTAELYNPATGAFTATGSMQHAHYTGTATLLQNGKVLIAGGVDVDGTNTLTLEIYDPVTGSFTLSSVALSSEHHFSTAVLLASGKVIICGTASSNVTAIYNPTTDLIGAGPNMAFATGSVPWRVVPLTNGNFLFVGGGTAKAQVYNPSTNTFAGTTGDMAVDRSEPVAVILPNGKALVAGGFSSGTSTNLLTAELYDPGTGLFTATTNNMSSTHWRAQGAYTHSKFYAIGGVNTDLTETYDPATGLFSSVGLHTSLVRSYRVAFRDSAGLSTLACAEVSATIPGDTGANLTWDAPTNSNVKSAAIYGRSAGVEQLIAVIDASSNTYVDTGTITPSGALPTVNATGNKGPILDQRSISWVGISRGDNLWRPLIKGVPPSVYSSIVPSIPQRYDIREAIEVWPAPIDTTYQLHIKGYFTLGTFEQDGDTTTIDWQAVYLKAVADAKIVYKQADAQMAEGELSRYIGDLVAGSHTTQRYFPGAVVLPNATRPILLDASGNVIS